MRAIMYHYVRPDDSALPYFKHLELGAFYRQLDFLERTHRWVSRDELRSALMSGCPVENGLVMTFDDGFSDHYRYVYPELLRRGISGIFYVPIQSFVTGRMLEVHRIHMLLGRHGGKRIFECLQKMIREDMLSHKHVAEFYSIPYRTQTNDECAVDVKRTLNYLIDYSARTTVMDELMAKFLPDEEKVAQTFYLSRKEMQEMHGKGMIIGSHTVSHPCMSKLNKEEQKREIQDSFAFLEDVLGRMEMKTYCHPYGGSHSFTRETVELLDEAGCLFSFSVEYRDISAGDLIEQRQALPRYDCNMVRKFGDSGSNASTM